MIYFISLIHVLTCLFIVLFVLLQDPKGGVLGSIGGGGGRAFFGAEGASPFLVKVTKWLAVIFACSSFYLSYISSQKDKSIITQELLQDEAPVLDPSPAQSNEQDTSLETDSSSATVPKPDPKSQPASKPESSPDTQPAPEPATGP